jgi:hypothetical protein
MGKVKNKMFELVDLVIDYYVEIGDFDKVDDYIKENDPEYYNFYLYNKNYVIDTALEILKIA